MSGCTIVKCGCTAPFTSTTTTPAQRFQDKLYGQGRRVANYNGKGEAICTCCSTTHRNVGDRVIPKKKSGSGGGRSYVAVPPKDGWPGGMPEKNGWRP